MMNINKQEYSIHRNKITQYFSKSTGEASNNNKQPLKLPDCCPWWGTEEAQLASNLNFEIV